MSWEASECNPNYQEVIYCKYSGGLEEALWMYLLTIWWETKAIYDMMLLIWSYILQHTFMIERSSSLPSPGL
jgi:hypothetical protein